MVVSSAELAKLVTRIHDANFASRPELMVGKYLYYDSSDIGLAPYGGYWRQARKIATLELFTAKRVQSFRAIREEEVTNFVKSIASEAKLGSLVNLSERAFGLINEIMSRIVFSKRGEEQEAFRALTTKMSKVGSGFAIADLYPSIKFLQSIGGMKKTLKEMVEESNRILDPIILEHKLILEQGKVDLEDLVDVLLKFHKDDKHNDDLSFSLTTNNIKAIILEIFGAGSETSSSTMIWVMAELIKNPNAMEKVQNEVREVYQGKGTVDETSLEELKYLKMVIKETFRLHPPAPLLVPRETIEHSKIHGYDLPPKTRVLVNVRAIGRDPKCWLQPNTFMPERFEGSPIDYKGNHFELLPFGAGRRMCPGLALGTANIELPLAMLLYHFDWKLPNGSKPEDLDMDDLFGIAVRRKNDLRVIPIPYKDSCL